MWRLCACIAVICAGLLALDGCGGGGQRPGDRVAGDTLTIYSSLPLHGPSAAGAQAVLNAERLALAQIRGRIGRFRVVLKALDDATAQRGGWDPGQTTANAKIAIADSSTIGYIGELNSGASAISIPVLNRLGIPQISPASTAVGLTAAGAGAAPGEPDKYYPTGTRTFARVIPNDAVQATAQVKLQQSVGCRKTFAVQDEEVDGEDMANSFQVEAQARGLTVAGLQAYLPGGTDYSSLASTIAQSGADCVLISATPEGSAVTVFTQLAHALPSVRFFGSASLAQSSFVDAAQGGIPLELDPRVMLTTATLPPSADPPGAKQFYAAYTSLYGQPQPSAIYGYEAMSLMLNAIARATGDGHHDARRSKVLAEIFATRDRHSILGTYSITSAGDTTIRRYGTYRVVDGQLSFWRALDG